MAAASPIKGPRCAARFLCRLVLSVSFWPSDSLGGVLIFPLQRLRGYATWLRYLLTRDVAFSLRCNAVCVLLALQHCLRCNGVCVATVFALQGRLRCKAVLLPE